MVYYNFCPNRRDVMDWTAISCSIAVIGMVGAMFRWFYGILDTRFGQIDKRFEQIDKRLSSIEDDISEIKQDLREIETKIDERTLKVIYTTRPLEESVAAR